MLSIAVGACAMQTPAIVAAATASSADLETLTGAIEISAFIASEPIVIVEHSICQPVAKAFTEQSILSQFARTRHGILRSFGKNLFL
jgi:hypothetical protein